MKKIFIDLVVFFGGQRPAAIALGVTQGTVSGWIRGIHGCSAEVALMAEKKTFGKFLARDLRPSLADPSPTLNQMMPQISTADQSGEPSVNPSSSAGVA